MDESDLLSPKNRYHLKLENPVLAGDRPIPLTTSSGGDVCLIWGGKGIQPQGGESFVVLCKPPSKCRCLYFCLVACGGTAKYYNVLCMKSVFNVAC
ncbi:hypothetical protein NPIL_1781 [Nephila pilipes]|uniref:Uncharacterized protein n=1 Tax=Nephila pilipes TaxID=299642 RepID=A0A8X6TGU4_NEPPI|nr:hypothetical protein NPIL_1781 [Nephila pilipes]